MRTRDEQPIKHYKNHLCSWGDLLIPLLGTLVVMLPVSPIIAKSVNDNSGIYLYAGWRIVEGELPYIQLWDHKPPLVFYINALGAAISPGSHWGIWVLEVLALFLASYFGYQIMKAQFGKLSALISTFLWLMALFFIFEGGNQTTDWTLPLQFGAISLFTQTKNHEKPDWNFLFIGLLGGLAFLIKQTAIGIWLAIGILLAVQGIMRKPGVWKNLVLMSAGVFIIVLTMIIYFSSQGALIELWDAAFAYNFHFTTSVVQGTAARLRNTFDLTYISWLPIFPISVLGVLAAAFTPRKKIEPVKKDLFTLMLLDGVIELLLILMTGDVSRYYFETILPVLGLFSATVINVLDQSLDATVRKRISQFTIAILAIGMLVLGFGLYWEERVNDYRETLPARQATIQYVKEHTTKDDLVYVWRDTRVNYFSQRESPTRFLVVRPLMETDVASQKRVLEFLDELLTKKPALIIDTNIAGWDFMVFPGENAQIEEKVRLLMSNYEKEEMIDDWVIYDLINK